MIGNFLIKCAGSDKEILSKCANSERIKHIGFGSLVVIPAIIAFISMSYALSTIQIIHNKPIFYISGGVIWGLIIFAFDRFVVSTHRRKISNKEELKSPSLYSRLIFAFILGIVISHPIVMLYFDGTIREEIDKEIKKNIKIEEKNYQSAIDALSIRLNSLRKLKECKEKLILAEQSGHKVELPCGYSSGLPNIRGNFPRTKKIQSQVDSLNIEINKELNRINTRKIELTTLKDHNIDDYNTKTSFDYLKREKTLEKLKEDNNIIGVTQLFIMLFLIILDIVPVIFKTFAPFGMYDKILLDDSIIIKKLDDKKRREVLQKAYNKISKIYEINKRLDETDASLQSHLKYLAKKVSLYKVSVFAIGFGVLIFVSLYLFFDINPINIIKFTAISSMIMGLVSNFIWYIIQTLFFKS